MSSAVEVTLTLPSGETKYSHPLAPSDGVLPSLRQAVKKCQAQLNELLTEVVEMERLNAKNNASDQSKKNIEKEDEDEEDDEEDDDEADSTDQNCANLKSPAKRPKLTN